jgi:hydrogenase-1 operon protein HyaF
MALGDIPVVAIGPGSQPEESDGMQLDYIAMPKGMNTFRAPDIPEPGDVEHLAGAQATMDWLQDALNDFEPGGGAHLADLSGLDDSSRALVNQILGEGEVSIRVYGASPARIQESILAGVWRIFCFDAEDRLTTDLLEVAELPRLITWSHPESVRIRDLLPETPPDGVMNAMSILTELDQRCEEYEHGDPTHAINLTLLPLSPEDIEFLDETLGRGNVAVLSRGYGNCEVISTRIPGLWWVRYFNSMGTQILNSLEVTEIPAVACAAPEDIADSAERLASIMEPYWPKDDASTEQGPVDP